MAARRMATSQARPRRRRWARQRWAVRRLGRSVRHGHGTLCRPRVAKIHACSTAITPPSPKAAHGSSQAGRE